jgi:hypothetical protein
MADETATFALDLQDGTSGPAEQAAKALEGLKRKIESGGSALAQMQKAMRNLKQATVPNTSQIDELGKRIAAQKESVAGAQSSYLALGGTFGKTKTGAKSFSERLGELNKVTQGMPGPLGGLVAQFAKFSGMLGGKGLAVGVIAIAAGLVALTVAALAAAAALLKYGIASANARRSEKLQLEGLTKMRNWYGIAAGNAGEMQAAIDRVSGSTALGRDKITQYTGELYKLGLRGKNLDSALEGMAIKGAVVGDEGARAFAHWAAGANLAGRSVERLTNDVKARFGGVAAAQLLDLNVQVSKMHENFAGLFDDLKIETLLEGISAVTSLFSASTRSGQALKAIMSAAFQPLVSGAAAAMPIVKRFFQGIIIAALVVGIAVLKIRNWIRSTFGDPQVVKQTDLMKVALWAGAAAVGVLGVAFVATFGLITAALVAAMPFIWAGVAALGALALQGLILAAPFILGAIAIGALIAAGYQLYRLWKEIDWKSLGTALIEGIVGGIKASGKWLLDTVKNLGADALGALKGVLGIASPSKAFARLGSAIPQGVAVGVDEGKGTAQKAVEGVVKVPGMAGRGGAGNVTIDVGGITITTSAERAGDMAADVERELVPIFERIALQLGAALPRVPA